MIKLIAWTNAKQANVRIETIAITFNARLGFKVGTVVSVLVAAIIAATVIPSRVPPVDLQQ